MGDGNAIGHGRDDRIAVALLLGGSDVAAERADRVAGARERFRDVAHRHLEAAGPDDLRIVDDRHLVA